jgi:hypothetical protein
MIYKTIHAREKKPWVNSDAPEGKTVPTITIIKIFVHENKLWLFLRGDLTT